MSQIGATIDYLPQQQQQQQRLDRSSKRKLDEYEVGKHDDDDDGFSGLICVRMKKDEFNAIDSTLLGCINTGGEKNESNDEIRVSNVGSVSCSKSSIESSSNGLIFFVRNSVKSNTIVLCANSEDTIESVHEKLSKITRIPVDEQFLFYQGKLLQFEKTLADYPIGKDSELKLMGRMRSTKYARTCQLVDEILSIIYRLCKGEPLDSAAAKIVKSRVWEFIKLIPKDDTDTSFAHLEIFMKCDAPKALVALFISPIRGNKEIAEESIRLFLNPSFEYLPKSIQTQCVSLVLEFCKLLNIHSHDSLLYVSCRNTLGTLLETIEVAHGTRYFNYAQAPIIIKELFPFVHELSRKVYIGLHSSLSSSPEGALSRASLLGTSRDFSAFMLPLRRAIEDQLGGEYKLPVSLDDIHLRCLVEIGLLHEIFLELLGKIDECLEKMDTSVGKSAVGEVDSSRLTWCHYLSILKELYHISKIFEGGKERVISIMKSRRLSLNALIKSSKRGDDHRWILEHKNLIDFESKRHLLMLMLPDVKDEYEEIHEMLIDRAQLLAESFEYIGRADPESLHGGLFMEFKNEEATGPGVLREWFCLVSQAIFNPQNALFLACPNDNRRFFPNPASNVDPLHLEYFTFCGRVIALALMHKIQVGVVFDRSFVMQLAGRVIGLEDVRDADPCFYMSCKRILEMDSDFLDSDSLGLTFVVEIEEMGSRRSVELCPEGKTIVLNSKNRANYVHLLIQHRFVTSVYEQVSHFARGFSDILCNPAHRRFFFRSLELEDLDRMLHGSDRAICVKDWMAHTEYNDYKETDRQIKWFWKIVEDMSVEQRRVLLFFWTSVKYLPVEGFSGLQSRLHIYKTPESRDRLPSSHTCFYRLCLPCYPSQDVMQNRLGIITQEHFSSSFGIW